MIECSKKEYPIDVEKHVHHIIPQYIFNSKLATDEDKAFMSSPENLIVLSRDDHIKAHELLYEVYGNRQDQGGVNCLKGLTRESKKIWASLGAAASHEVQKNKGVNFWNKDYQRTMARRSMERSDALQIRSEGGKKGGRNKSIDIAINANQRFVFSFKNEEVLCIMNCETGGDVTEQLKMYENCTGQITKLDRATALLKRTRLTDRGWSCEPLEDKVQDTSP